MEKKYFEEFMKIFMHLKNAALILSGDFYRPRIEQEIIEIEQIVNQLAEINSVLFKNLFDEIEQNLYNHPESREIYLTKILRAFIDISPYLNIDVAKEYCIEFGKQSVKIGDKIYPNSLNILHKNLIIREAWRNHGWDEIPITIPEKYTILCFRVFRLFFNQLDAIFLNFNIDLNEIQINQKIQIWVRNTLVFNSLGYSVVTKSTEVKIEKEEVPEIKPHIKPEAAQIIFDIIKDFFSPEDQTVLEQILKTGNNAEYKLLFNGNGNRLSDTFKKLIEHDFITGCQKQDLQNWIISNFNYSYRNVIKIYTYDTVEKTISRNFYPCKSPLIEIKNGLIQKVNKPRSRKT